MGKKAADEDFTFRCGYNLGYDGATARRPSDGPTWTSTEDPTSTLPIRLPFRALFPLSI